MRLKTLRINYRASSSCESLRSCYTTPGISCISAMIVASYSHLRSNERQVVHRRRMFSSILMATWSPDIVHLRPGMFESELQSYTNVSHSVVPFLVRYLLQLRAVHKLKWRFIYWHIFARLHSLRCRRCGVLFTLSELEDCTFHPKDAEFPDGEANGKYQCCGQLVQRFSLRGLVQSGCQKRNHVPKAEKDGDEKLVHLLNIMRRYFATKVGDSSAPLSTRHQSQSPTARLPSESKMSSLAGDAEQFDRLDGEFQKRAMTEERKQQAIQVPAIQTLVLFPPTHKLQKILL